MKPDTEMRFRELATWYLAIEEIKGKAFRRQIEHRINLLNDEIGSRVVSDIKPIDLENYRQKRKNEGKALATIDDEITQAKTIVNKAFENGMISIDTLRNFKSVKKLLKTNANARDKIYTPEQFWKVFNNSPQHLREVLAIAYYTGMRKGEILGLTWDKVNLNTGRIQLEAIDTKTGEPRTCPIFNGLYEILVHKAKERKHIKEACSSNYVILYMGNPLRR